VLQSALSKVIHNSYCCAVWPAMQDGCRSSGAKAAHIVGEECWQALKHRLHGTAAAAEITAAAAAAVEKYSSNRNSKSAVTAACRLKPAGK
jgi:hypothetical protein